VSFYCCSHACMHQDFTASVAAKIAELSASGASIRSRTIIYGYAGIMLSYPHMVLSELTL
jgi:hypothetical protein